MSEKSDSTNLIILGVGIVMGGVIMYLILKSQQTMQHTSTGLYTLQQPAAPPPILQSDTELMKWYADNIIKPSIETTAKYAVKEALNTFNIHTPALVQPQIMKSVPSQSVEGTYKNNESWEFKRGRDGRLEAINVIRNAKTNT